VTQASVPADVFDSADVETLTIWCREAIEQTAIAFDSAVQRSIRLGRILVAVKSKLSHGEWIPWVKETFGDGISLRKVQQCMRHATADAQDPALLAYCTILTEADAAIGIPSAAKKLSAPETYDAPIEVTARESEPEKKPSVKVREPKKPKPVGEFVLVNRLDEDRERILDIAGEYSEHRKLAEFVSLLKGLLQELLAGDLQP
jgi:hypothetical protein